MRRTWTEAYGILSRGQATENSKRRDTHRRAARPQFEPLEDRTLMYGTPLPDGISFSNGTVRVNGGGRNDSAVVAMEAGQIKVSLSHTFFVQADINTTIATTLRDPDRLYDPASVTRVYFVGRGGDDSFRNDTSVPCDALGYEGFDLLTGGGGNDNLNGGDGADVVEGRGGNDQLVGGPGSDTYTFSGRSLGSDAIVEAANADTDVVDLTDFGKLFTRTGSMPLSAGATLDLARTTQQTVNAGHLSLTFSDVGGIEDVRGTVRADTIRGNARANRLYGYAGNDELRGLAGNDLLYGGDGNDDADGGAGNDAVYGDNGDDQVRGGLGDDNVYGGTGNDVLRGDTGSDHLYGEAGNDTLYGSLDGRCWLSGGDGNDTLVSVGNATNDALTGGTGSDSFWCDAPATETVSDLTAAENAAGHVHRIGSYFGCHIDNGTTVQNLGAPGLSRNGMTLADPLKQSGDGGFLANFSANPLFSSAGPARDDIDQGAVGDCYFVAALSAVADTNPDLIRQTVVDLGDGTYAVNFHGALGTDVYVRVDADLWASAGTPTYANFGAQNSMWVPIVEKAYAFYKNAKGNYGSINGGNGAGWTPAQALGVGSSGFSTDSFATATLFLASMRQQWLAGKAITVGGPAPFLPGTVMSKTDNPSTSADENTYRRGAHVYTLVSVASDLSSVTLRNPWSSDGGGSDSDPNDGYVTIPANIAFYCSGGFRTYAV
jgi:Ca2+-binding RTX toxin-like protein